MITLFEDREALAQAAAALFTEQAQTAVAACGRFTVLLAGGETPRLTYQLLAQEPHRSQVPWADIHFFWGDERCVPSDDPRSNALLAHTALLDHVPVRAENIHPISCDKSPQHAADAYGVELAEFFDGKSPRFDLVFLGLGDDGHTASLLPGSASLDEQLLWTAIAKRPEEDFSRVTLTATIINQAAMIVFLVAGSGKAQVLRNILCGSGHFYPAQLIQPLSGDLRWYVDSQAGSLLGELSGSLTKMETPGSN